MKVAVSKATLIKFLWLLKWGKVAAKIAIIGATVTGAVAAVSGLATTGIALSAAGATAYAATRGMPKQRYEKTQHVPPGVFDKTANLLRKQEMEVLAKTGNVKSTLSLKGLGQGSSSISTRAVLIQEK